MLKSIAAGLAGLSLALTAGAALAGEAMTVDATPIADLAAYRVGWIERSHRLLENHGDAVAAKVAQGGISECQKILALEQDLTGDARGLALQQA